MTESAPFDPDQLERDLEEMWRSFQAVPDDLFVGARIGVVRISTRETALLDVDEAGNVNGERPLTDDELKSLQEEFPQLFVKKNAAKL